ncbi:MAG: LacI family DNA-binding transcriptional regulator [Lachnospiraceae bacterium]|nr:LacI family DNA-binding transcriptional regulator [Lachnospiraceae bacterium]
MITIKQIAKELNMSTTTVSNVIHGKTGEVSSDTIERVRAYLDKVGYVPNLNAQNLAANQSHIIGVVIKTRKDRYMNVLCEPFVSEILGAIEQAVRDAGYFMMLYISEDMADILNKVAAWNTDGLLLFWMLDDDALRVYKRYRKPVVCVDTYISRDVLDQFEHSFVNIGLEDETGAYEAVLYLAKLGHKRIAFMSDNREIGVDARRLRGFKRALAEQGIECSDDCFFELRSGKGEIQESMESFAERAREFTAVICCSDVYASMLISACENRGVRIPEDLSVIGFDDTLPSILSRPAITTVHQDIQGKGNLAITTLLKMIQGEQPGSDEVIMKTSLVVRDSTARPSGG